MGHHTSADGGGRFDHLFASITESMELASPWGGYPAFENSSAIPLTYGYPAPELLPVERLQSAVSTVFSTDGADALQYSGGELQAALVRELQQCATRAGLRPSCDEILTTSGSSHALEGICRTFLEPGDPVFVEVPTYLGVLHTFDGYGAEVVPVPLDHHGIDVDAFERQLRSVKESDRPLPSLLFTIPNFQNPTGATLSRDRRERLIALAEAYDFVIVEDDVYGALRYDGTEIPSLGALDSAGRVISIGSLSKLIAPGVRTGWIVADADLIPVLRRCLPSGGSSFIQSIVAAYCRDEDLQGHIPRLCAAYRDRRDRLVEALGTHLPASADWIVPAGGFFVWLTIDGVDTAELLPHAAEVGVTYFPGAMFHPDDRPRSNLRLSFSYVSPDDLETGAAALGQALHEWM